MALFKFIQNDKGQVLLNRSDLTGSAVLGTYDVHGTPAMTPVSDADLREFAEYILEKVPKPSPIKDARFIQASSGDWPEALDKYYLAKIDGKWCDSRGRRLTETEVLNCMTNFEVIA